MDMSPTSPIEIRLRDYVRSGRRRVDGWLTRLDAGLVAHVGRFQVEAGIPGAVGEIGVHHGRLFILLALMLRPGELAFAVDVFESQHLNLDRSGFGDEAAFRGNLARFGIGEDRVRIFKASSLDLDWERLRAAVGQAVRLFSIDGGHTAAIAGNDLRIADEALADGGVVILDDYFNPEFPAVSEALCRHLAGRPDTLAPVAIGDAKLLLCRPGWAGRYRAFLRGAVPNRHFVRATEMFGMETLVFRTPSTPMQWLRQSALARRLGAHPSAQSLKPLVRRFLEG